MEECVNCKLMRLNPQPDDKTLGEIYGAQYFIMSDDEAGRQHSRELKSGTANSYLDILEEYRGASLQGELLEVGCGHGDFLVAAAARGLRVTGIEYSEHSAGIAASRIGSAGEIIVGEISALENSNGRFDFIVFADVLEHVRDPRKFLSAVHALLNEGGLAVAILPSLDSMSAKFMGSSWMEFKVEHLWYFNTSNLQRLMHGEHFGSLRAYPAKKTLSAEYIAGHFQHYPVQPFSAILEVAMRILPRALLRRPVRITASGIAMVGMKAKKRPRKKLSVVMAAYNEATTIAAGIDRVLAKQIDGVDIELIVVESNSTDGTREIVESYSHHPGVEIVLQDRAMGKGNAVRAGFTAATGDFILIQDADDEYDIDDYDVLLEPLLSGEVAFVLGARHGGGSWKMRHFADQPLVSTVLNFGHWVFATLINVLYGTRLRDPFTMYKVFRTDCLRGLSFECDRFDFDHELVIKLVRKGFVPLEIPVNYRSRSFKEGKKVDAWRDPLTWMHAIIKYRFQKI